LLQKLEEKGAHTNFRWIPAHAGIEGNERADQAAKEVARQSGAPTRAMAERQREVEGVIILIKQRHRQQTTKPTTPGNARTIYVEDRSTITRKTHTEAIWCYVVRPNRDTHTSANRALPVEQVPFHKKLASERALWMWQGR
jgi:hypothetical protein